MNPPPASLIFLPAAIQGRVRNNLIFCKNLLRYQEFSDQDLVRSARTCLSNLERFDEEHSPADTLLRHVLVPEICTRITPDVRDALRRVSTSLAEHDPDPRHPSIFDRFLRARCPWGTQARADYETGRNRRLRAATSLRASITFHAALGVPELVERTGATITRSNVVRPWDPSDCVYEPGFTYRVVPALLQRLVERQNIRIEA